MIRVLQVIFFALVVVIGIKAFYTWKSYNIINRVTNIDKIPKPTEVIDKLLPSNDNHAYKEYSNYAEGMKIAKDENRKVFIIFSTTWCGPCLRMKATTFSAKEVKIALKNYVVIKLDADEEGSLFGKYKGSSIPYYLIVDRDENILKRGTGYRNKTKFIDWIEN